MISERDFVNGFPGFWSECLPYLTSGLVTEWNRIGIGSQVRKYRKPVATQPGHLAGADLVAEFGFRLFVHASTRGASVDETILDKEQLSLARAEAIRRITGLRHAGEIQDMFLTWRSSEAYGIARNIQALLMDSKNLQPVACDPFFQGCGVLDSCYGDIVAGSRLIEVKAVQRGFRSADIRQLLVYCALNFESRQYDISEVSIVNPRRGIEFRCSLEQVAQSCARASSFEVLRTIADFLSELIDTHQVS